MRGGRGGGEDGVRFAPIEQGGQHRARGGEPVDAGGKEGHGVDGEGSMEGKSEVNMEGSGARVVGGEGEEKGGGGRLSGVKFDVLECLGVIEHRVQVRR